MKRKLICVILCLVAICCIPFSAYATSDADKAEYNGVTLPKLDSVIDAHQDSSGVIVYNASGVYTVYLGSGLIATDSLDRVNVKQPVIKYKLNTAGEWEYVATFNSIQGVTADKFIWANQTIKNESGSVFYELVPVKYFYIQYKDFAEYGSTLIDQISLNNVVAVLVVGVTACVGLVFLWWGVRKGVRALMTAFKKGKVSL